MLIDFDCWDGFALLNRKQLNTFQNLSCDLMGRSILSKKNYLFFEN